jgi:hypothetical protein
LSKQLDTSSIAAPGFAGLNLQDAPTSLEAGFALEANNCVIDKFGRIGARKGWTTYLPANSDLSTLAVKTIAQMLSPTANNNQLFAAGNNKLFLSTGSALAQKLVRNSTDTGNATYTITNSHWQVASLPSVTTARARAVIVQAGQKPLYFNYSTVTNAYIFQVLADLATLPVSPIAHTSSTFTPNCAVSAYGRIWTADIASDRQTVYFSDLTDPLNFQTGTAGSLNIAEVVGDGDPIVAIAAHNGFLIIFCENHILVYANAQDPSALTLSDNINGIGCIARDSVQATGTDIIFLSSTGVRSLSRTVQEKSMPMRDISKNVRDALLESLSRTSDLKTIKSGHSSTEAVYVLSFSEDDNTYCFDTRSVLPDGSLRTTTWTKINPTAFCTTASREFLLGQVGYIGLYNGYTDNGTVYRMSYYSSYFDFQQPTMSKILKKIEMLLIGAQNQDVTVKWDFDFKKAYQSAVTVIAPSVIAEYGIGEYNIGEYSGGIIIYTNNINGSGAGKTLQLGFETNINNNAVSLQKVDVFVKGGKKL